MTTFNRIGLTALLMGASLLALGACNNATMKTSVAEAPSEVKATVYPETAYFGDTHVHTGWSADAGQDGAVTSPEDAFRLASGEEVTSNTGQKVKLNRPGWSSQTTQTPWERSTKSGPGTRK